MDLLAKIREVLKEGAEVAKKGAKVVIEKTAEATELATLKLKRLNEVRRVEELFTKIGARVYDLVKSGKLEIKDKEITSIVKKIKTHEKNIESIEKQIKEFSSKEEK